MHALNGKIIKMYQDIFLHHDKNTCLGDISKKFPPSLLYELHPVWLECDSKAPDKFNGILRWHLPQVLVPECDYIYCCIETSCNSPFILVIRKLHDSDPYFKNISLYYFQSLTLPLLPFLVAVSSKLEKFISPGSKPTVKPYVYHHYMALSELADGACRFEQVMSSFMQQVSQLPQQVPAVPPPLQQVPAAHPPRWGEARTLDDVIDQLIDSQCANMSTLPNEITYSRHDINLLSGLFWTFLHEVDSKKAEQFLISPVVESRALMNVIVRNKDLSPLFSDFEFTYFDREHRPPPIDKKGWLCYDRVVIPLYVPSYGQTGETFCYALLFLNKVSDKNYTLHYQNSSQSIDFTFIATINGMFTRFATSQSIRITLIDPKKLKTQLSRRNDFAEVMIDNLFCLLRKDPTQPDSMTFLDHTDEQLIALPELHSLLIKKYHQLHRRDYLASGGSTTGDPFPGISAPTTGNSFPGILDTAAGGIVKYQINVSGQAGPSDRVAPSPAPPRQGPGDSIQAKVIALINSVPLKTEIAADYAQIMFIFECINSPTELVDGMFKLAEAQTVTTDYLSQRQMILSQLLSVLPR